MAQSSQNVLKLQGRKAKALYPFKATLNDELNFKAEDIIILIQSSEDGTWHEGTLNSRSGWFPSNYVQILDEEIKVENSDKQLKIEVLNEIIKAEDDFMDNINKFLKVILIPMQVSTESILNNTILKQLQSSIDKILEVHTSFEQTLKEIPQNPDARIGFTFLQMATQFKPVYESYAKMNPRYIQAINKQKDALNKYFESNRHLSQSAVLYTTKSLASPFKQIEIYVKMLKEVQRLTEDYHADRGDIQRAIEFYEELSLNTHELRSKKEYELEIMSCRINNLEEDLFKNGESLFLSSVLIIYENGDKKDQILMLFPYYLIILSHNSNNKTTSAGELNFESKINLLNNNLTVSRVDGKYDNCKYCFELSGTSIPRLVIVCSTLYDLKTWTELLNNMTGKPTPQSATIKPQTKAKLSTDSQKSFIKAASPPIQTSSPQPPPPPPLQQQMPTSPTQPKKQFAVRPHPPLIPHFQLPNDAMSTNVDGTGTLKRFMYKKPQLSEPFGKYHGADDDLRLLNTIESYWKTKMRQSVNINIQEGAPVNGVAKTTQLQLPLKIEQDHINNLKSIRVNEEKIVKLEAQIVSLTAELNEYKRANKDLKMLTATLKNQLENEKILRSKLEQFIQKYNKVSDLSAILQVEQLHQQQQQQQQQQKPHESSL